MSENFIEAGLFIVDVLIANRATELAAGVVVLVFMSFSNVMESSAMTWEGDRDD